MNISGIFFATFAVLLIANFFILGPPWRDEWRGKARGLNNYGLALQNQGRIEEAKKFYIASIRKMPNYSHPYINMGTLCEIEKDFERATRFYKVALKIEPKSASARYNLANCLFYTGHPGEAVQNFRALARAGFHQSDCLNNAGYILNHQGKKKEAIQSFVQAIAADQSNREARENLKILARSRLSS